jgi:hypothetical protein
MDNTQFTNMQKINSTNDVIKMLEHQYSDNGNSQRPIKKDTKENDFDVSSVSISRPLMTGRVFEPTSLNDCKSECILYLHRHFQSFQIVNASFIH